MTLAGAAEAKLCRGRTIRSSARIFYESPWFRCKPLEIVFNWFPAQSTNRIIYEHLIREFPWRRSVSLIDPISALKKHWWVNSTPARRYNTASLEIHQRRSIPFRQLRLNCFETFSSHVVTQNGICFSRWSKEMLTQSRQIQFRFKLEWIFNETLVQTRFTSFFNYEKSR